MQTVAEENVQVSELAALVKRLPRGAKTTLALRLGCTRSKISEALTGFVKDPNWLSRMRNEAEAILAECEPSPD